MLDDELITDTGHTDLAVWNARRIEGLPVGKCNSCGGIVYADREQIVRYVSWLEEFCYNCGKEFAHRSDTVVKSRRPRLAAVG